MAEKAQKSGAEILWEKVSDVVLECGVKRILLSGGEIQSRTIVAAGGAYPRKLEVPGEDKGFGRGVSYCAECDGPRFAGKIAVVVGGGDSAVSEALYLSAICRKVYLIHRRDTLRAVGNRTELMLKKGVELIMSSAVREIVCDGRVSGVKYENLASGEMGAVDCDAVFIAVGRVPETGIYFGKLNLDPGGYIKAGEDCAASVPGVYAAGDIRTKKVRQIVTALADGAVSAIAAREYISNI